MKTVLLKLKLKGKGLVNYDSSDQKYVIKKHNITNLIPNYNSDKNVAYAKKTFYYENIDDNDVLKYKNIISSAALKKAIYCDDVIVSSTIPLHYPEIYAPLIATPTMLMRGYLFAKSEQTIKNKSKLTLTSAAQTNDGMSYLEICTKSGNKKSNDDSSDTSLFYKETIGEITYEADGSIDLNELQFLSFDDIFDRLAVNPDDFAIYKKYLNKNIPSFNGDLDYYKLKTSIYNLPEKGVLLDIKTVDFIVKHTLKKILKLSIVRNDAYAEIDSLSINIIDGDVYPKMREENDNWIELKNDGDVDKLHFEYDERYVKTGVDDYENLREKYKNDLELEKNVKKRKASK